MEMARFQSSSQSAINLTTAKALGLAVGSQSPPRRASFSPRRPAGLFF
jgi:hypothetical protein